jgi:hypothetical protein
MKKKKVEKEEKEESTTMRIQPKLAENDDWEIKEAVSTLAKAEEIKQDKEMMGKIKPLMTKKIRSIEGLKKYYDEKYNQPGMAEAEEESDDDGD